MWSLWRRSHLTGHYAEASEALQRYLTPTALFKTIAAWKARWMSEVPKRGGDPRILETGN
jgi:hypothetical protein